MSEEVKTAAETEVSEQAEAQEVPQDLSEAKAEGIVRLSGERDEKAQAKEDMRQRRERLLKGLSRAERRKNVTREDLILILDQITENMSQISHGLMADVNAMYSHHVFPALMWIDVFKSILIDAKLTTEDDLVSRFNSRIEELQKKALEAAKEKERQEAMAKAEAEKASGTSQEGEGAEPSEKIPENEVSEEAEEAEEVSSADDGDSELEDERKVEIDGPAHVEGRKLIV